MVSLQHVSRRQHHRFERPELAIRAEGFSGRTQDWSLGGVAIRLDEGQADRLDPSGRIRGNILDAGMGGSFDFQGRVVRVDAERNLVAIEFERLSEGALMMFVQFFRVMMSGTA